MPFLFKLPLGALDLSALLRSVMPVNDETAAVDLSNTLSGTSLEEVAEDVGFRPWRPRAFNVHLAMVKGLKGSDDEAKGLTSGTVFPFAKFRDPSTPTPIGPLSFRWLLFTEWFKRKDERNLYGHQVFGDADAPNNPFLDSLPSCDWDTELMIEPFSWARNGFTRARSMSGGFHLTMTFNTTVEGPPDRIPSLLETPTPAPRGTCTTADFDMGVSKKDYTVTQPSASGVDLIDRAQRDEAEPDHESKVEHLRKLERNVTKNDELSIEGLLRYSRRNLKQAIQASEEMPSKQKPEFELLDIWNTEAVSEPSPSPLLTLTTYDLDVELWGFDHLTLQPPPEPKHTRNAADHGMPMREQAVSRQLSPTWDVMLEHETQVGYFERLERIVEKSDDPGKEGMLQIIRLNLKMALQEAEETSSKIAVHRKPNPGLLDVWGFDEFPKENQKVQSPSPKSLNSWDTVIPKSRIPREEQRVLQHPVPQHPGVLAELLRWAELDQQTPPSSTHTLRVSPDVEVSTKESSQPRCTSWDDLIGRAQREEEPEFETMMEYFQRLERNVLKYEGPSKEKLLQLIRNNLKLATREAEEAQKQKAVPRQQRPPTSYELLDVWGNLDMETSMPRWQSPRLIYPRSTADLDMGMSREDQPVPNSPRATWGEMLDDETHLDFFRRVERSVEQSNDPSKNSTLQIVRRYVKTAAKEAEKTGKKPEWVPKLLDIWGPVNSDSRFIWKVEERAAQLTEHRPHK